MNHQCIVCRRKLPEKELFTLENAPASAQQIPDRKGLAADRGVTLRLHRCPFCGLTQFDTEPVSYYKDVIRSGGLSATMTGLRRSQYAHLIEKYGLRGKRILEAGCGRGEFLSVLAEFPVQAFGIEHRKELCELARRDGLLVTEGFAGDAEAVRKASGGIKFDAFLSFNYLEHQPDPAGMLRAVRENLTDGGIGLVTVPALEYIAEQKSYYELIRDHIAYYSFSSLEKLLALSGFRILEKELVNRDTISVIVRKEDGETAADSLPSFAEDDEDLSGALAEGHAVTTSEIRAFVRRMKQDGKSLSVWGASHQGFTLLSTTELGGFVTSVIDSAPFKQGRFAPASHVPILSPDDYFQKESDAVLILAPGYTDEIAGIIRERSARNAEIFAIRTAHIENISPGALGR